jgi:glycosyltransferase involved in cell wall biosynthesis
MKIAVYGISKNEHAHAERWAETARDADVRLVCDTGSTDATVETLDNHGVEVIPINLSPFRFDDARNAALSLLPADVDYCISLDHDEVLAKEWRSQLEPVLQSRPSRVHHGFATHWKDGSASQHYHERIHARHGYRWVLPVHEKLVWYDTDNPESTAWAEELMIRQYPDHAKDRSSYLPMLERAITEPSGRDDWKIAYFLASEYLQVSRYPEARDTALRCLAHGSEVWPEFRQRLLEMIADCDRNMDQSR